MRRVQIDADGNVRCWRCGSTNFNSQRTLKGKVGFGFLAPKKMKCMGCGAFNQHGTARQAKKARSSTGRTPAQPRNPDPGWLRDPKDPSIQRWYDGTRWTEHTRPDGPPA